MSCYLSCDRMDLFNESVPWGGWEVSLLVYLKFLEGEEIKVLVIKKQSVDLSIGDIEDRDRRSLSLSYVKQEQ